VPYEYNVPDGKSGHHINIIIDSVTLNYVLFNSRRT